MFRTRIKQALAQAAETLGLPAAVIHLETPVEATHGDYATNLALVLARPSARPPREIGEALVEELKKDGFEAIVAGPGFVNITISRPELLSALTRVLEAPEEWGRSTAGEGKTVIVEYFQLNIAKTPHVGHLRSAVIGDALKRMLLSRGCHAVSDTHVGDWGTQFGILLWAYKNLVSGKDRVVYEQDPFNNLEKLYQAANLQILSNPELREEGKKEFAKLERGDEENRQIWQWMVEISMEKLRVNAERLGLLPFDEHMGESAYETMMPPIVALALDSGVAKKTADGAVIADLTSEGLDEAVLIKSDGASTYLLRDLATIKHRKDKWRFWRNLYIVDVRQSHHFRQLFRVAELLGFEGVGASVHVESGFMTLPEGPMSTRKGNTVHLEKVMDEAVARARRIIAEKNPDLRNADEVAEAVGIGALKYFDLSHHRKSDIVFSWDEALNFEGNTAPYIQYTNARLRSILRKISGDADGNNITVSSSQGHGGVAASFEHIRNGKVGAFDETERLLLVTTTRFPEIIEDALEDFTPNTLANYLFTLAQRTNEFYHTHPVTQETNRIKKDLRIDLISAISLTLARGLGLLGIKAPEEM
ncbi:MAG: arginine--tRNA ligase [bacterium]|nr:arginine--tRNA ligase [bacterium]MDZ4296396.1 arginine--tRNA ligase [Patescibacteria group bacterium]